MNLTWVTASRLAIKALLLLLAVSHLYFALTGYPGPYYLRGYHVGIGLGLIYLITNWRGQPVDRPSVLNVCLGLAVCLAALYPAINIDYVQQRFMYVDDLTPWDLIVGTGLVVLVLEGARRTLGLALPLTAVGFIVFALVATKTTYPLLVEQLFLTTDGIFGIPVAVSATFMVLFIVFGAMVERMGIGKLFMDFAIALTGRQAGGPAKVSCITSGLFGSVSGSAVANVMTTGAFSIPLMKRIGFRPSFAASVEAVSSTGGQIMPPVMGAAAFVMAEYLGVSYLTVAGFALMPAVLYYVAVFAAIHFEAKRLDIGSVPKEQQVPLGKVLIDSGHMFVPLALIVGVLLMGYSAPFAALCGIASVLPAAFLRKTTRHYVTLENTLAALEKGARNALPIAAATACAGIVVGVINVSGIGLTFSNFVISAADDTLVVALLLSMVAGIILGMGMPTTPAYIVQVALMVPALVSLGVQVEAAHLFVFYFAILSAITPPVAMAVYAANALAGGKVWESSVKAVKLGVTGFIIPFLFVYEPAILLQGDPLYVATVVAQAAFGVVVLAAALHGYLLAPLKQWHKGVLLLATIGLIYPDWRASIPAVAVVLLVVLLQRATRPASERAEPG
ncbi:MAG: TRAP transporter fused permease subunit [Kiloniellales bacterium]|nr:TRAP transporter fused permease subunit [Kiloniellales bacterium]